MAIRQDQPVSDDHHMPLRTIVPGLQSEKLSAIFKIVVTRQKRSIMQYGARIELAFDKGEIQAGGTITPINEVELELKAGSPVALFALARTLGGLAPLQLSSFSKAQRGYNLLSRDNETPVKSQPIVLTFGMTSSEGFQAIAYAACTTSASISRSCSRPRIPKRSIRCASRCDVCAWRCQSFTTCLPTIALTIYFPNRAGSQATSIWPATSTFCSPAS